MKRISTSRDGALRVVVSGLMGSLPIAGLTAHYLQYVLGLRALGHDVLYLEDTGWYYDPWSRTYCDEWSPAGIPKSAQPPAFLRSVMDSHDLADRWTYVAIDGEAAGVTGRRLADFLAAAELFVHVTGAGIMRDEYLAIPHRAYVDTDPGYVQMRIAAGESAEHLDRLASHTSHFSFGVNIGNPDCAIPDVGFAWRPTVQPLHFALWPPAPEPPPSAPFSTVIKWTPYDSVRYEGQVYGMKDSEFVKFADLPRRTTATLELAMDGSPPLTLERLEALGWRARNALDVSGSLARYREYITQSRGEWSVAKNGYVTTRSGWFGDRSAAYLATGRPVVMQDTGFERWLPTGEGVFTFSTVGEAVAAIDEINRDYRHHSRASRELAETHFRADRVLADLVEASVGG